MEGLTLIIDKSDTSVSLRSKSLFVKRTGEETMSVPLGSLHSVVVYGRPMISCDVWRALADSNIGATVFPARGNGAPAFLGAGLSTGVKLRQLQHAVFRNPEARLATARSLVAAKMHAYLRATDWVEEYCLDTDLPAVFVEDLREQLEQARERLSEASTIDQLLGHEGAVSRAWFSMLRLCVGQQWNFNERNRRPPKDPVNALLSLSYSLLAQNAQRVVQATGLDPALGFLHETRSSRPALALDIMEAQRPGVDVFVLYLLDRVLTKDNFSSSNNAGCTLDAAARRTFYLHWIDQINNWPDFSEKVLESEKVGAQSVSYRTLSSCCRRSMSRLLNLLRELGDEPPTQS